MVVPTRWTDNRNRQKDAQPSGSITGWLGLGGTRPGFVVFVGDQISYGLLDRFANVPIIHIG